MEIISLYSLLIGLAAAIGLWRIYLCSQSLKNLIGGWFVLIGILVGARLGYVLMHHEFFSTHPDQMARFWLGGLSGIGALWGGFVFCLLPGFLLRRSLLSIIDLMSSFVLPLTLADWIGSWLIGLVNDPVNLLGRELTFRLGTATQFQIWVPGIAALLFLITLGLAERLTRNSKSGMKGGWLIFLLSLLNLGLCVVYPGEWRIILGMKADTLLWLITSSIIFLFLFFLYLYNRKQPKIEPESENPEGIHEA